MSDILIIGRDPGKVNVRPGAYKVIYAYEGVCENLGPELKDRCTVIPEDLFTALDFIRANNRACIELEKIYDLLLDKEKLSPLDEIGGTDYAEYLTKKAVVLEMEKIFRHFMFAEKVMKHFQVEGKADFIPEQFSFIVYRAMSQGGMLPRNIVVHRSSLLKTRFSEMVKNYLNVLRLLFYPETLLLQMKNRKKGNAAPGDYAYGVYIHGGRGFSEREGGMDFFIDEKQVKSSEVLFVADEQPAPRANIKEAKRKGYQVVNFHNDMVEECGRLQYLKEYYPKIRKLGTKFIGLSARLSFLSSHWYHALKDYALWELFHDKYSVGKFMAMQHPGKLTRVFRNRDHGSENIFIHSAIVFDRLDRRKEPEKGMAEQTYYSHLVYDRSVSDKSSNTWLSTSQNDITEYVNIGSIFSDIVFNIQSTRKEKLRNKFDLPADKTLISFFDGTIGHIGVLDFQDVLQLAADMINLLNKNKTYYILFKFKKPAGIKQFPEKSDVAEKFNELFAHPRFLCVNDLDITAFELMGISDLVVSTPLSSVVFESVIGGIKTIYYDPTGRYAQKHYTIDSIPHFTAHGFDELDRNITYWLDHCSEKDFLEFKSRYITEYTGDLCDGNTIQRFRDAVLTA